MSSDAHRDEPRALAARAAKRIAELSGIVRHDIAVTLGTGWSEAAHGLGDIVAVMPATRIPGFHVSGVSGHSGTLTSVRLADGRHALLIGARTHLYQGLGVRAVAHGARTAAATGARVMVLTNGCGGIRPNLAIGQPVVISDHINLTATSPVEGDSFIDMTDLYSLRLRNIAHSVRDDLPEGVYVQMRGPQYETPAEIRMAALVGGDLVGMSTALEAIAAREAGLEVLGLALVTNRAAGQTGEPLRHRDVVEVGVQAQDSLTTLLADIVLAIDTAVIS